MRRLVVNWLHLACLWTLAVCLPLFQVLSDSPDWLIAEHAGFPALPLAGALFVLLPPTAGIVVDGRPTAPTSARAGWCTWRASPA